MGSITDIVTEALKYPFNDTRHVLLLGIFCSVVSILSALVQYFSVNIFRFIANGGIVDGAISSLAQTDFIIVAVLSIIVFILAIFISGYCLKVSKYAVESKFELPSFKNPFKIFITGLKVCVVIVVYYILPIILITLGLLLTVNQSVGSTINMVGLLILLIALIFHIFVSLFILMAIVNMVVEDKLSAAFKFKDIYAIISNLGWLKYIGIIIFALILHFIIGVFCTVLINVFTGLIGMALSNGIVMIILGGLISGLIVEPYLNIYLHRVIGSIYREATNKKEDFEVIE